MKAEAVLASKVFCLTEFVIDAIGACIHTLASNMGIIATDFLQFEVKID